MNELVAIDIGGTHVRFALAQVGTSNAITLDDPVTLYSHDYASLQIAWREFEARVGSPLPTAAAIAVAAPVTGEVIHVTNNPWIIRQTE